MKCTIPEISWHNRDPVLSLDIQPVLVSNNIYRLASGGTDSHVLIWHLKILDSGVTSTEAVSDLTRHQRAVNVVRWSPSGQYLASGDDDANIIIWHQKSDDLATMLDGDTGDKEKWNVLKVLRGHKEDVYDICWSPDSTKLISGSVDNTAIIWNLAKGDNENIIKDHKGFVQGVTWDPLGQFVATLCSDRTFRVFNETGKKVIHRMSKGCLPVPETHPLHKQEVRYYHDDTLKSFFRRLAFSPDGNLVITPTGCLQTGDTNKYLYTTYIYTVASLSQPVAILPSPSQYTVAARCCPILFELWSDGPDPTIALPYRMIIAVATQSSVILYDTQQTAPFAIISNIHYTRLTDLTWSHDGRLLAVSSTDGFCSLVTFEADELGKQYVKEPEVIADIPIEEPVTLEAAAAEEMDTSLNSSVDEKKEKRPSFLEQWAIKTPKSSIKLKPTEKLEIEQEKINKVNSASAKPIAVRRYPRTTDQLNKTEFLKSRQTPKNEETPVYLNLDDSVAQDAWNSEKTDQDTQSTQLVLIDEPILIEDSQDIKLVMDESTIADINDMPKPTQEIMKKDSVEYLNKQNTSKISKAERDLSKKSCDTTNAKTNKYSDAIPVHKKDPLNKKRVPLITLSSPKHKKNRSNL